MPAIPPPSAAITCSEDGGAAPRAATKASITVSDEKYIAASTTGTGSVRLLRPPRKSASPHRTDELSARKIAAIDRSLSCLRVDQRRRGRL